MTHFPKSELTKCKTSLKTKTWKKKENKESGTKVKRTTSGKKINKIKCPNKKKVKKPINNGKKNPNSQSLKSAKSKIKGRPPWPDKTGFKEESSDTDGKKLKSLEAKEVKEEDSILKITKQRFSKKNTKQNLSKKLQRAKAARRAVQKDLRVAQKDSKADQKVLREERVKEDDILIVFSCYVIAKNR